MELSFCPQCGSVKIYWYDNTHLGYVCHECRHSFRSPHLVEAPNPSVDSGLRIPLLTRDRQSTRSKDRVDHPAHYQACAQETRHIVAMFGVPLDYLDRECIEVIELLDLNFHLGNALKYLWRFGQKSEAQSIEDLKKARWYIEKYLKIGVRRVLDTTEERDRLILSKIDALILKNDDQ